MVSLSNHACLASFAFKRCVFSGDSEARASRRLYRRHAGVGWFTSLNMDIKARWRFLQTVSNVWRGPFRPASGGPERTALQRGNRFDAVMVRAGKRSS